MDLNQNQMLLRGERYATYVDVLPQSLQSHFCFRNTTHRYSLSLAGTQLKPEIVELPATSNLCFLALGCGPRTGELRVKHSNSLLGSTRGRYPYRLFRPFLVG